jgi:hypothetical protein
MTRPPRITSVDYLGARNLRLTFSDGLVRELDLAPVLRGFLATIDDDEAFARVEVDAALGTIVWPGAIDLDPDVLHGDHPPASGPGARVIREYHLRETG